LWHQIRDHLVVPKIGPRIQEVLAPVALSQVAVPKTSPPGGPENRTTKLVRKRAFFAQLFVFS
jgi:hypothetical protein